MNIGKLLSGLLGKALKNEAVKAVVLSAALSVAAANIDKAGAKVKAPVIVTELAKQAVAEELTKALAPKL